MISLIYPYRNRDINRLKLSLDSLKNQSVENFRVFFVDYGSQVDIAHAVAKLCSEYSFVSYRYCHTLFQPWNKSRTLNNVIKDLEDGFCFVADVDIIFHPQFIERAIKLQSKNKTIYFQVGFLKPHEILNDYNFFTYKNYRLSDKEATGLSLFPIKVLKELRGFDEFYHFWGAEDTDIHIRIKNAGYEVDFYEDEVLMLHQWHPSYRNLESTVLSQNLQISNIVQLNHQHLKYALQFKITKVNLEKWGECICQDELNELEKFPVVFVIDNERKKIDHLLYSVLPVYKTGILKIIIQKKFIQNSPKYIVKKLLGKKVSHYYSLKEVNDKILLHLISFYRNRSYTYKISEDFKKIELAIKF